MTRNQMRCGIWLAGVGVLAACAGRPAFGAPPKLEELPSEEPVPRSARTGQQYTFRIQFIDPDGDRPRDPTLVTEGPEGIRRWLAQSATSNRGQRQRGVTLEFVAGPFSGGQHTARFEVTTDDGAARYPGSGGIRFNVENIWLKWIALFVGLAVALLFLPLIVFVLVRSVSPGSDPSRAARFGLLVGLLLSYAWFIYLFGGIYPVLWVIILGILVLGALFALLPRKV